MSYVDLSEVTAVIEAKIADLSASSDRNEKLAVLWRNQGNSEKAERHWAEMHKYTSEIVNLDRLLRDISSLSRMDGMEYFMEEVK